MLAQVPAFQREGARDGRSSRAFPSAIPGMPLGLAGEQELACGGEDLLCFKLFSFLRTLFWEETGIREGEDAGKAGKFREADGDKEGKRSRPTSKIKRENSKSSRIKRAERWQRVTAARGQEKWERSFSNKIFPGKQDELIWKKPQDLFPGEIRENKLAR